MGRPGKRRVAGSVAAVVAVISGVFSLVLSVLIITDHARLRTSPPLENRTLDRLKQELSLQPGNEELRREVRELDLLARTSFFSAQSRMRVGGVLLLAGVIVTLAAGHAWTAAGRSPPPLPGNDASGGAVRRAGPARQLLMATAAALGVVSVVLVLGTDTELDAGPAGDPDPAGGVAAIAPASRPAVAERLPVRPAAAENHWPSFRGPYGNGHAFCAAPTNWVSGGRGVHWQTQVRLPGYSSPAVWEDHVYLTGSAGTQQELYAFDAETGALLWTRPVPGLPGSPSRQPDVFSEEIHASPSPVTDGQRVCAVFANGDVICTDSEGALLWGRALGIPDNHYGHSSSPLIHDGLLLVQMADSFAPRMLGLDTDTGEEVWRTDLDSISWASPICVQTGARAELILATSSTVYSLDPSDGEVLWREECMAGEMGPSPAFADGMVFAANDGAAVVGIRLGHESDGPQVLWRYDEWLPDVASPLAASGFLFVATSSGTAVCLEARTGTVHWEQDFSAGFYASPVLADDLIYALDMDGGMHIFHAGSNYNPVAEIAIGEKCYATPAIAAGRMYVRGDQHLYCITGSGE